MNYRYIFKTIGRVLELEGLLMILPIIIGFVYNEPFNGALLSFIISAGGTFLIGLVLSFIRPKNTKILPRASFIIVALSWLVMALFGSLPLIISKEVPNFFDAFFEMCSGFTTTGASILNQVESLSKSILFWRSFSHWIGGMGVIVFILAVLPNDKEGSRMHILRAESPGPQVGKLTSKVSATARILYLIYIGLTAILFLLLFFGPDSNMDFFSSITITMGTAGTGGFTVLNSGMTSYSPYSQYVVSIFMLLFGTNFTIFYLILVGKIKAVFKNEEIKIYAAIVFIAVAFISLTLFFQCRSDYPTFEESFRHALFQVASIISTTGYSTTDYAALWPTTCQLVIVFLMLTGPCAGSTGGGIKISRISLLVKSTVQRIRQMINPNKVTLVKDSGEVVEKEVIDNAQGFFILFMIILFGVTFAVSFDGFDSLTNFTATLACISNIGPGLSKVGPMSNFAEFSYFSKFILSLTMIAGRLELFPLMALFFPHTWKNR